MDVTHHLTWMEPVFALKLLSGPIATPDLFVSATSNYTTHCRIVNGLVTSFTSLSATRTDLITMSQDAPRGTVASSTDNSVLLVNKEQPERCDGDGAKYSDVIKNANVKKSRDKARRQRERTRSLERAFQALDDVLPYNKVK